ncbi:MAG: hypothetical protein RLY20_2900, partial [Verrucomicrobiota bacterium]
DSHQIVANVFSAVNAFTHDAPPTDDRTLVVIKAL